MREWLTAYMKGDRALQLYVCGDDHGESETILRMESSIVQ